MWGPAPTPPTLCWSLQPRVGPSSRWLVALAARGTRTWASRSRADLEALAQVNPDNLLIPGTKIGKISRSVGKALGQI